MLQRLETSQVICGSPNCRHIWPGLKHGAMLGRSADVAYDPRRMAPEVLRSEPYGEKADVYSFGVVLWEMLTGELPWADLNAMQACSNRAVQSAGCQYSLRARRILLQTFRRCITKELQTGMLICSDLPTLQVVGAVGFAGRQLPVPEAADPLLSQICSACMSSDPAPRPSFASILETLERALGPSGAPQFTTSLADADLNALGPKAMAMAGCAQQRCRCPGQMRGSADEVRSASTLQAFCLFIY